MFTTQKGTSANDAVSLIGTSGIDITTIGTQANGLYLIADQADDTVIFSEAGSKYNARGDIGDDKFEALAGISESTINGNAGQDLLSFTSVTNSNIYGGKGADTVTAQNLISSSLYGNIGTDTINVTAGLDSSFVYGGKDTDTITINGLISGSGVNGDLGADIINIVSTAFQNTSSVQGGANDDTINVTGLGQFGGSSSILGGQGNDTINGANAGIIGFNAWGGDNNDTMTGGAGGDGLTGGNGDDSFTGGAGIDTFGVDIGSDRISDVGNGGADNVVVSGTATLTNGQVTADWVATNASSINGTAATFTSNAQGIDINLATATGATGTTINGFAGAAAAGEILISSAASSSLNGLAGNDSLTGNNGNDSLTGGAGVDNLTGQAGNDTFVGGTGVDTFSVDAGSDVINDLGVNSDVDVVTILANATLTNGIVVADWTATGASSNAGTAATFTSNAQGIDISLAAVTGTTGNTITGFAGAAAAGEILIANNNASTLSGLSGNDSLTGGTGGDILTGGAGADNITVGADTAADAVTYSAATDGAQATGANWATTIADNIIGMVQASDDLRFIGDLSTGSLGGTTSNAVSAIGNAAGIDLNGASGLTSVQLIAGAGGNTAALGDLVTLADLNLATGAVTNETAGDERIFIFNASGTGAFAAYKYTTVTADNAIAANELTLLSSGTLSTNTNLVAANVIFA